VGNGIEREFQLRTKKDKVLPKSIITKEKADLTQGTIVELPASMGFKDSNGVMYLTQSSITLRCAYGGSPQTFDETFYVVQSCELDALLRHNISQGQLKDELSCLPLKWGRKTQGTWPSEDVTARINAGADNLVYLKINPVRKQQQFRRQNSVIRR
jgi:hypothetical protein